MLIIRAELTVPEPMAQWTPRGVADEFMPQSLRRKWGNEEDMLALRSHGRTTINSIETRKRPNHINTHNQLTYTAIQLTHHPHPRASPTMYQGDSALLLLVAMAHVPRWLYSEDPCFQHLSASTWTILVKSHTLSPHAMPKSRRKYVSENERETQTGGHR